LYQLHPRCLRRRRHSLPSHTLYRHPSETTISRIQTNHRYRSHRLICSTIPWSHPTYVQLVGRLYRQGHAHIPIDMFFLFASAHLRDTQWSYDHSKWDCIAFKRTFANTATNGIISDSPLQNPQQAYPSLMAWLGRLAKPVHLSSNPTTAVVDRHRPHTDPQAIILPLEYHGEYNNMTNCISTLLPWLTRHYSGLNGCFS